MIAIADSLYGVLTISDSSPGFAFDQRLSASGRCAVRAPKSSHFRRADGICKGLSRIEGDHRLMPQGRAFHEPTC